MKKSELTKLEAWVQSQLDTIYVVTQNGEHPTANEYILKGTIQTLFVMGYDVLIEDYTVTAIVPR